MLNLAAGLVGQVIGLFGEKGKAQQEALKERVSNMQRSLTDEFIAAIWFSPVVMAWFDPARADAWIAAVFSNQEYSALLIAITAAVFGLGKINGKK